MTKIDFKKQLNHLYNPSHKAFSVVEVPAMQFLMVDGHGTPGVVQAYQDALEALYAVAYKIKFASKQKLAQDYTVPPLEGLWWADDMTTFTTARDKSQWDWTMMIMQPDWITTALFAEACATVKKQKEPAALSKLRLETVAEGLSVQIMHIGSYDDEGPILHKLHHEFMPANDYIFNGKHHEIYLNDPRRVSPEKLKTILRQPVISKQIREEDQTSANSTP
ncbi:MAG: GyrI-like domain-containing protein [Anaerolineae bacterium]|nr:GyrI-like domain-containing protein [Anaerolineae bacterium]